MEKHCCYARTERKALCLLAVLCLTVTVALLYSYHCISPVLAITFSETHHICATQDRCSLKAQYDLSKHKSAYISPGLDLYIHTAFVDDRFDRFVIRIFGLQKKGAVNETFVCQWDSIGPGGKILKSEVPAQKHIIDPNWPKRQDYHACRFDCEMPPYTSMDQVTLVSVDQLHSYKIPVEDHHFFSFQRTSSLAVCVKPMTGELSATRLVEWIEIQRGIGIEHFILYNTDVRGTARYVIEYYEKLGLVTVVSFPYLASVLKLTNSGGMDGVVRYSIYQQIYLVAMQDCLYRFRRAFTYLAFIDIDEVILPTTAGETLEDALQRGVQITPNMAGYMFYTAWHFEDTGGVKDSATVPNYLYMQKYAIATYPLYEQPKSIICTDYVLQLNFHGAMIGHCENPTMCNYILTPSKFGYVHHYRGQCIDKFPEADCKQFLSKIRVDPVISRYRNDMLRAVRFVLDHLQMV